MNFPNQLTLLRLAFIPLLVIAFYLPFNGMNWITAGLFTLACITDWIDGYLARKWSQTSSFGKFLDPVADKLIVVVVLILLVGDHASVWLTLPAIVIIFREVLVSALREWMAELGNRVTVAVSIVGKWKTGIQMFSLGFLLLAHNAAHYGTQIALLGYILLYIASVLTMWSMWTYLKAAWPSFDWKGKRA